VELATPDPRCDAAASATMTATNSKHGFPHLTPRRRANRITAINRGLFRAQFASITPTRDIDALADRFVAHYFRIVLPSNDDDDDRH
jgi:hypothetical protein